MKNNIIKIIKEQDKIINTIGNSKVVITKDSIIVKCVNK